MRVVTLTLSPAFDVHCHTPHFEAGSEHLATVTQRDAGGKGVNISRALTVNGTCNTAVVVLGSENGDDFKRMLDEDNILHTDITVSGRIRENFTIHTDSGEETRISFGGFSADTSLLFALKNTLAPMLTEDTILALAGSVPNGVPMGELIEFLSELRKKGVKTIIDSRSFNREMLLKASPWLIKPNQEETALCLGSTPKSREDVIFGAVELYKSGIDNVMISLGAEGALLVCKEGTFMAIPPKIKAVSTIGAGDSMIAGFISAKAIGRSAQGSLKTAVSYGSAACMREGTKPPLPCDIEAIYRSVSVEKI